MKVRARPVESERCRLKSFLSNFFSVQNYHYYFMVLKYHISHYHTLFIYLFRLILKLTATIKSITPKFLLNEQALQLTSRAHSF